MVVMVWPQHQWLLCCLHTELDRCGGGVDFAAKALVDRELRGCWQARSGWHINVYLHRG